MTHALGEVIAWIERAKPWILRLLILALILRATVLVVAAWPFTLDDTYVTLRYAKHLAAGQGLAWNLGERPLVEGYSNFTFVLLGAVAYVLGLDPVLSLKIVGVLALGLTAVLSYGIARFWVTPVAALCPVALYLAFFGPVWWAVSGMETLTYVVLVLAAVFTAFRGLGFRPGPASSSAVSPAWLSLSGALVCLAAMTRPEGPLVGLAIGVGILMRSRNVRALAVFAGAAGIPYAVYFVWRSLYFHRLLPNPVYCKGRYAGDPFILVEDLAVHAAPFLLALTAAAWRRLDARHAIAIVLLLLYLAALFDVDPILAQGSRLSLAPQTVLISVACGTLLGRLSQPSAERLTLGIVVLSSAVLVYLPTELRSQALSYRSRTEARLAIGRWISETIGPGESYVMGDVGAVTLQNERRMLDAYCLNSAVMTRPPINRSGERYARWLLRQEPRVIVMPSYFADSLLPHRYMDVFPVIAEDSGFKQRYRHVRTVSVPGTIFHYWLYRRADE